MSARNKDAKDRQHSHLRDPEDSTPAVPEDQIEIVEVVGVDEATGAAPSDPADPRVRHHTPGHAGPASHGDRRVHLKRLLDEALQDKGKYYDLLLRKQAEFENFRRRSEREREEFRLQAAADIVTELLPALDNLDRALASRDGCDHPIREGVVLIRQQILEVLKKVGVQPLESLGAAFDPRQHEAVDVQDIAGFEKGMVLEEVRKGYVLNDRLLRPAMVKVASGSAPGSAGPRPGGDGDDPRGDDR